MTEPEQQEQEGNGGNVGMKRRLKGWIDAVNERMKRLRKYWIDAVVVLAALLFIVAFVLALLPGRDGKDASTVIAVPASSFIGAGALSSGQEIELVGFVPDLDGTPVPQIVVPAVIQGMRGANNDVVLMALPTEYARNLQTALLNENTKLTYSLSSTDQDPGAPQDVPPAAGSVNDSNTADSFVRMPLPVAKLVGGAGPLDRGQLVELVAYVPNEKGTPAATTLSTHGTVRDKDAAMVLMSIPATSATSLQAALAKDGTSITYSLITVPPTPTPAVEAAATPTPTVNLLEIPVEKLEPGSSEMLTTTSDAKFVWLVITQQQETSTGQARPVATPFTSCGRIEGYSDQTRNKQTGYEEGSTTYVKIELPRSSLGPALQSLEGAASVYLAPVAEC